jgi:hypothetical protein
MIRFFRPTSENIMEHTHSYYAGSRARAAGVLSLVAGLLHLLVAPEHFDEWIGYGLFFVVVALAQLVYAQILVSPRLSRGWLAAGIIGHLFIIALYVVTRTVGIPAGPMAGEVEGLGFIDLLSKAVEVGLIVSLAGLLRGKPG